MTFEAIQQVDIPQGRNGKHKATILKLLEQLEKLRSTEALKIPLAQLPDSKQNIRSALNRATRQRGIEVATSSDDEYFYIWKPQPDSE